MPNPAAVSNLTRRERLFLVGLRILAIGAVFCSAKYMSRPLVAGGAGVITIAAVWLALGLWRARASLFVTVAVELWLLTDILLLLYEKPAGHYQEAMRLVISIPLLAIAAFESSTRLSVPVGSRGQGLSPRPRGRPRQWTAVVMAGAMFTLLLATQYVRYHLRNQSWKSPLLAAASGADSVAEGINGSYDTNDPLIAGKAEVARFLAGLEMSAAWSHDPTPCLCLYPEIVFLNGKRRILTLQVSEEKLLIWPGGPWRTAARLTEDAWQMLRRSFGTDSVQRKSSRERAGQRS